MPNDTSWVSVRYGPTIAFARRAGASSCTDTDSV
jgi:hypothetical protein